LKDEFGYGPVNSCKKNVLVYLVIEHIAVFFVTNQDVVYFLAKYNVIKLITKYGPICYYITSFISTKYIYEG